MGGAWAFPGGGVDEGDHSDLAGQAIASADPALHPWRAAAVRELVEETGIWLLERGAVVTPDRPDGIRIFTSVIERGDRFAGDSLRCFANWITPALLPIRFDTRFFAAVVPLGIEPAVDGAELVDAEWIRPTDALERARDRTWSIAFPTRRTLAGLATFVSTTAFEAHVEMLGTPGAVEPRIAASGATIEILMPTDSGYDDAAPDRLTPAERDAIERVIDTERSAVPEIGSA